ncbi:MULTISPECIES: hypothetical protein [unclassified Crossiella]|uniref:mechanosensitive ion channel family protein n=1 Tax=unclassified Crossiella TaxID=2620835 RepID=UPI0020002687|nr:MULTISPECIES: hypothetical protein [unclassified Crossiella]MCK2240796.1 hypothetical protein [Crossiella sp. S99.2]MCK2254060.1 hypothetical protein [Crossiella sp. S99.1]
MGGELRRGLADAWSMVATFVPKLFGFLLILLVGWLIAKALAKVVSLLLRKTGFNKLADKAGVGTLLASQRVDAAEIIVKLVYYFVLLIALQLAFGVFGAGNAVSQLLTDIIGYLPRIIVAIVLLLVAAAIARIARDLVGTAIGARPFTALLRGITYAFILALGVIAALNQLGIATTVTTPVLIAVLATVGGILVVGVGGGLIRPMQDRWGRWLNRIESEAAATRSPAPAPGTSNPPGPPPNETPTPPAGTPIPPTQ